MGTLASSGSTRAFHGPWNGLPSTNSVSSTGRRHSQLGREFILFRRMLRVCSFSSAPRAGGNVLRPVLSVMSTRSDVRPARKTGSARRGLDAMFNSSRQTHAWRTGGSATKKLAEMSSASNVVAIGGIVFVRNVGTEFGVLDDPIRR